MNWQHFFGVWTAVVGIATFASCSIISVAAGEYRTGYDSFDKRLWLIPGGLALLTAVFGSVTALIAR